MKKFVSVLALSVLLTMTSCGSQTPVTSDLSSDSQDSSLSGNVDSTTQGGTNPSSSDDREVLPVISNIKVLVKASSGYTHFYSWNTVDGKTTEYFGQWPGTTLQKYDDTWLCCDLPEGLTSANVIFHNNKGNQTEDLSVSGIGYHWYDLGRWSHSDIYGGDFSSSGGTGGGGQQTPMDPVEADSYKDFSLWNELGDDYFTVLHPYQGQRNDFRDETIYFAITTRFYDGDPSNNIDCWDSKNPSSDPAWRGDFKGLIEKLDYIKALGFTAVWITPVVENASGYDYHGYHALNFSKIDSRYESEDVDFEVLLDEVHKRDMKLVLDVVFNHTGNFGESNLFPMFVKEGDLSTADCLKIVENSGLPENYYSLNGGQQYDARIANMKNTKNNGSDPNDIYHHYGNFSWESFGEQVAQIAGDCVDLNTENPIVAEYLVRCYGEFIRMGVDYFRIDTMKHISRLTLNNYILPGLYEYARRCGNDNFYMFGEVCARVREIWNHGIPALSAPFYTWKESKQYAWGDKVTNLASIEQAYNDNSTSANQPTSTNATLTNGVTYHTPDHSRHSGTSVIDFPMHWNFMHAQNAFNVAVGNDKYYNDATYNVVYVDSHDYGPDEVQRVRYNQGTEAWAENMSLMFTFRGIPCIYYGSEIEFQAGKIIDDGTNTVLSETGRAYFGDNLTGSVKATDFGKFTASGKVNDTLNSTLSKHLQKLNQIRLAVPALRRGQYTTSNVTGNMAFVRRYTEGNIDSLACVAISGSATFRNIPNGNYVDLVSGKRVTVNNGTLTSDSISKGNARIYVLENSYTGTLSQIGGSLTYLK